MKLTITSHGKHYSSSTYHISHTQTLHHYTLSESKLEGAFSHSSINRRKPLKYSLLHRDAIPGSAQPKPISGRQRVKNQPSLDGLSGGGGLMELRSQEKICLGSQAEELREPKYSRTYSRLQAAGRHWAENKTCKPQHIQMIGPLMSSDNWPPFP